MRMRFATLKWGLAICVMLASLVNARADETAFTIRTEVIALDQKMAALVADTTRVSDEVFRQWMGGRGAVLLQSQEVLRGSRISHTFLGRKFPIGGRDERGPQFVQIGLKVYATTAPNGIDTEVKSELSAIDHVDRLEGRAVPTTSVLGQQGSTISLDALGQRRIVLQVSGVRAGEVVEAMRHAPLSFTVDAVVVLLRVTRLGNP